MEGRFVWTNRNVDCRTDNIDCILQTALLAVFSKGTFPLVCEYWLVGVSRPANSREQITIPTVLENYVADIEVDGKHVELGLYDTGCSKYYKNIRPLSYPDSHVILICFDISKPDSLDNVQEKVRSKLLNTWLLIFIFRLSQWIIEVNRFCQGLPIILVGLKKDLRNNPETIGKLWRTGQHPVTVDEVG